MKRVICSLLALITAILMCACTINKDDVIDIVLNNNAENNDDNQENAVISIFRQNTPQLVSTPEPTLEPTTEPFVVLQYKSEGETVETVQKRLVELNYLHSEITGYFGEKTVSAVEKFQKTNNLEQTGIVDEETYNKLLSSDAEKCTLPLAGYVIGIDPGHQTHSNREQEPIAPGSSTTKKKVSSGTQGRYSGVEEYKVNLQVGLLLRDLLEEQGATVLMTRETNDVDISNVERAQFFNNHKTDYALRLHCNGTDDTSVQGAFMLVPTENPYKEDCVLAAQLLIDAFCDETGANNMGLTYRSDQTGFNWCERMVINIEMGHMSNKEEDYNLVDSNYQKKMARGILNGILAYFETK